MTKTLLLIGLISFSVLIISCQTASTESDEIKESTEYKLPKRQIKLSYFETEFGWGYDIEINGKNYIHQIHLPCECGGEGFKTKEKAALAAEFLKEKIENHKRKLTISKAQLDSLGAL